MMYFGETDISLTYPLDGLDLSREAVEAADVATLLTWYEGCSERMLQLKSFVENMRFAQVDDEEYYRRSGGVMAYTAIATKWIENRLLSLGVTPPYPPADPRNKALRALEDKLKKVTAIVKKVAPDMLEGIA